MTFSQIFPLSFFMWCQRTSIGIFIKKSTWAFAVTETVHIICLSILLGSTLVVDLRLLGRGMTRERVKELSSTLLPWTWFSFVGMVVTGIVMFDSEAAKLSQSVPFFYKIVFLFLAVLFHLTIHRRVTHSDLPEGTGTARIAAALSLVCWLSVALAGRAIAFF